MSIDDMISYYTGKVVHDKKVIREKGSDPARERELRRHMILPGALRCARANGYSSEE